MSFQAYLDKVETQTGLTPRAHRDASDRLWLDGKDSRPADW